VGRKLAWECHPLNIKNPPNSDWMLVRQGCCRLGFDAASRTMSKMSPQGPTLGTSKLAKSDQFGFGSATWCFARDILSLRSSAQSYHFSNTIQRAPAGRPTIVKKTGLTTGQRKQVFAHWQSHNTEPFERDIPRSSSCMPSHSISQKSHNVPRRGPDLPEQTYRWYD
jgi:hypothetical protein